MTTHQIVQNWFTTGEAAAYCRISPRTLRRWTKANRVRAYDGKYFRDDLDRAVRNGDVFPAEGSAASVFVPRDVVRGLLISDTPIRWKALSPEETRMMDEHGTSQPNERPEHEEGMAPVGCSCSFQPTDTPDGWTPDPGCPWHGERPYLACSKCNYDQHTCPGCGDNLKHGVSACAECLAESAGSGGPENDRGTTRCTCHWVADNSIPDAPSADRVDDPNCPVHKIKHGPGCNDGIPIAHGADGQTYACSGECMPPDEGPAPY